jgi:hypothetical protein
MAGIPGVLGTMKDEKLENEKGETKGVLGTMKDEKLENEKGETKME